MGTLLLEFTKIESHLPTIMMPSHGHNQVHLVPANKIFCLLFSFSVAIKYEKRDLEDLLKLEVNLKRVFNQLTLCHVIVIVSMLHNILSACSKSHRIQQNSYSDVDSNFTSNVFICLSSPLTSLMFTNSGWLDDAIRY